MSGGSLWGHTADTAPQQVAQENRDAPPARPAFRRARVEKSRRRQTIRSRARRIPQPFRMRPLAAGALRLDHGGMDGHKLGPIVVAAGLAVALVGLLLWVGALSWFGRLPGDLRWESDRARVYVPITSMLIVSLALSGAAWLLRRWLG